MMHGQNHIKLVHLFGFIIKKFFKYLKNSTFLHSKRTWYHACWQ